ncbi:MAG: RluA family pseudouridine synthase [Mangrovicoccus sp.]|nr:RluA family pseudouridine synthase [Mangrovicoccus sp.]
MASYPEPDPALSILQITIGDDPPARLDKALARDVPEAAGLSRTRLARLISEGQVRCEGQALTDVKTRMQPGAVVEITLLQSTEITAQPEAIPLSVIYEDAALIVVDKPAGMVVHPAPGSPSGTLVNALLAHCGESLSGIGGAKRPGIVHRIDKDTSGLLVVAKSDAAHQGLAAQFAAHSVMREYRALVHGVPEASDPRLNGLRGVRFEPGGVLCITTLLDRHRTDRQKQAVSFDHGRRAVTRGRVEERFGSPAGAALVSCWLETGRTHQIRVHMAYAGHGLLGDPVYGGKRRLAQKGMPEGSALAAAAFPRQALHAAVLGFEHPISGEMLRFESPLPADMETFLTKLRG